MNKIEDLKTAYEEGTLEPLYSATLDNGKDAIILQAENGFKILFNSKPNWICTMHYQYLPIDDNDIRVGHNWIVETTYEKENN